MTYGRVSSMRSGAQVGVKEVNRRYDMRTGERLNRIGDNRIRGGRIRRQGADWQP